MPDSPQQRHQRVLLPRYGAHFSTVHSHVVLQLRRCINSIFGTGIISQCCDGGVDPAVHPELRDLRGYAENTLLASLYGHHLICILSAMLHVGRSQAGRALPCVRPWLLCVPRTPPWPHLAKYNVARWQITARKTGPPSGFQNETDPTFVGPVSFWNPAVSYSPGPSPAKYHRR